jgi:Transglutaminase-like superfamily
MINPLEFFATPGAMTSAGNRAGLLDGLPGEIGALCKVIQGVMLHIFWAEQYGVQLAEPRREEVQLRWVARQLERIVELDRQPLTEAREPEKRLVGNCRDFSVLLTAILRHQGVPARARCGFGRYFLPDHYEDHWVGEYWSTALGRWVLVDAQLDALQCDKLAIPFNPLDVPRDQFIVGGKAWQMCRARQADPDKFGIFDMHGLWFVRGDFARDVAALNKVEMLPWDSWGILDRRDEELSAADWTFLDQVAELTSGDVPEFDKVRKLYEEDERLRVPATIRSYAQTGVQVVELG